MLNELSFLYHHHNQLLNLINRSSNDKSPHLLLISSLLCGDPNVPSLPRELLVSYLQGQFTDDASKVCRVIICGGGPSSHDPLFGLKELDAFLLQLTKAGIPVLISFRGSMIRLLPIGLNDHYIRVYYHMRRH